MSSATEGDVHVVDVAGELDLQTTPSLRAALDAAETADGDRIVLSLSGVTFIDSTALGLLLETAARTDRLRIISSPAVDHVIELSGMRERLPLVE